MFATKTQKHTETAPVQVKKHKSLMVFQRRSKRQTDTHKKEETNI